MNTARYVIALLLYVSLPPGLLLWFAIHPFTDFWRRVGVGWTYGILALPTLALMVGLFRLRRSVLAVEFGTRWSLVVVAVIVLAGAIVVAVKRRRYLTYSILAGVPQLSRVRYPGTLLTEGIYGRIRHPRYVEVLLGSLAYALFANYLAGYILVLASIPVLYLIVVLEEKELRARFGAEFEDYCRRVPRFVPRMGGRWVRDRAEA